MSEQFTVKIKIASAEKSTRELLTKLATALGEDDYAAVRQIVTEALNGAPSGRDAQALVAALLLPCSEYGPAEAPFLDALCGALEDASAYLQVSGSKKLGIELGGTDNGTADAAAYLLALLYSLPVDGLEATGKGFTWMARWACDAQGVLQTASYEPLDEGRRIDPKADEKLRRKVQAANKKFLKEPYGFLVAELDKNCGGSLSGFLKTIKAQAVLGGQNYADISKISGQCGASGDYSSDSFSINCGTSGPQSVEIDIVWHKLDISPEEIHDYFKSSDIPFINHPIEFKDSDTGDVAQHGDYEWAVDDIAIRASIGAEHFKLRIVQRSWIKEVPLLERCSVFIQASVLEAVYWRDLSDALEAEAKNGNREYAAKFNWLCEHPRPGCKNYAAYLTELHDCS
jgi:hypothetical protein